jgi:hypothetical protein
MKKHTLKLAIVLFVVLILAAVVVAVMQSGSQILTAASQQEVKDTRTKDLALDALSPAGLKKAKSPAKTSAKAPSKQEEAAAPAASGTSDDEAADRRHQELARLIEQAQRERDSGKRVGESTKQGILALKNELGDYYRSKASDAAVASSPDRVAFYQAAAKKIEALALAASKDELQPRDAEAIGDYSGPETRAFTAALKKTDRNALSSEQKSLLLNRSATPLVASANAFCSLYTTAMSLAQQLQNVAAGRAMAAPGCSRTAGTGTVGKPSPDLGLVQAVVSLLRVTILGYRDFLLEMQNLTGASLNVPALPAPPASKLIVPTEEAQKKEKDEARTEDEKTMDFVNAISPNPKSGSSGGASGGGSGGGGGCGGH